MSDKAHYEVTQRNETEATVRVTIAPDEVNNGIDSVYRRYAREVRRRTSSVSTCPRR